MNELTMVQASWYNIEPTNITYYSIATTLAQCLSAAFYLVKLFANG